MSGSNCCFLTCIQVSEERGKMACYPHFFQNFPQFVVIHTVKWFSIVSEAEVDGLFVCLFVCLFLEFTCYLYNWTNVGNLTSGSSAFSKSRLYIWKFSIQLLLKPSLKELGYNLTSMGSWQNCLIVWTFFSTALLQNLGEDCRFPVLWPLLSFPNSLTYWVQHLNSIIF